MRSQSNILSDEEEKEALEAIMNFTQIRNRQNQTKHQIDEVSLNFLHHIAVRSICETTQELDQLQKDEKTDPPIHRLNIEKLPVWITNIFEKSEERNNRDQNEEEQKHVEIPQKKKKWNHYLNYEYKLDMEQVMEKKRYTYAKFIGVIKKIFFTLDYH